MGSQVPVYNDEAYFNMMEPIYVTDEQIKKLPFRLIGMITMDKLVEGGKQQEGVGTGTLISSNLVITAAHNIYNHETKREYSNFRFHLAQNGLINNAEAYQIQRHYYHQKFKQKNTPEYDIAILKLKKPTNEKRFIKLLEGITGVTENEKVGIYGYIAKHIIQGTGRKKKAYQEGLVSIGKDIKIVNEIVNDERYQVIVHKISTEHGQSGASIFLLRDNQYYFIGIHKGSISQPNQQNSIPNKQNKPIANIGVSFTKENIETIRIQAQKLGALPFNVEVSSEKMKEKQVKSPQSCFNTAEYFRQKKKWQKAVKYYETLVYILENNVLNFWSFYNYALCLINWGKDQVCVRKEKYEKAQEIIDQLISLVHQNAMAQSLKAYILTLLADLDDDDSSRKQKYIEALQIYQKVNKIQSSMQTQLNIITVLNSLHRYKDAQKAIAQFEKKNTTLPPLIKAQLKNAKGYNHFKQQRIEQAIISFQEAVRQDPEHEEAHLNLGSAYQQNQQYRQAIQEFSRVLEINQKNSSACNNMGVCQFLLQEMSEKRNMRSNFLEAMFLNPFQPTAYQNYLMAFRTAAEREHELEATKNEIMRKQKIDLMAAEEAWRRLENRIR